VLVQSYRGSMQVSIYDDASDDGSDAVIRAWVPLLRARGVAVVASGSRWSHVDDAAAAADDGGDATPDAKAGGIGHGKNRSVAQSTGELLVFLDADDIMRPGRGVIKNSISNGDQSMTDLQGNCSYRRADTIGGG